MNIKELFQREKDVIFLSVVKSSRGEGIRTYFNPMIEKFPKAYREQLISFLEGIIKDLRKK